MVAMSEKFHRRWENERERREEAELIELARWLMSLFGRYREPALITTPRPAVRAR